MIEMASVLKSSALTEYSFAFRFPNLQWNIKLVTLFTHQLHPLIYGLVNQKLSITAVIIGFFFLQCDMAGFWQFKVIRLTF